MPPATSADHPSAFASWRVVRKLGAGGQATTYVVVQDEEHRRTERVLKALNPWTPGGKAASEAEQRGRFHREVNALRALAATGCPNIVPVIDADLAPGLGQPWYVMPLYVTTVYQKITDYRGEIDEVLLLAENVAKTLAWMHGNEPQLTHRDVHTDNIFVDIDKRYILGDFGLVHVDTQDPTTVHTGGREAFGPWRWRPPELHPGSRRQHDPKSDVYLLGGVIYEALTGGEYIEETEHGDRFTHEDDEFTVSRFTEDPRAAHVNTLLRYMLCRAADARLDAHQIAERCLDIREWSEARPSPIRVSGNEALRAAVARFGGRNEGLRRQAQQKKMLAIAETVCAQFRQYGQSSSFDAKRTLKAESNHSPRMVGKKEDTISDIRVILAIKLEFPPVPELKQETFIEFTSTPDMRWHIAVMKHFDSDFAHAKTLIEDDTNVDAVLRDLVSAEIAELETSLASRLERGLQR
jgi:serine/threonine protein kinase